MTERADVGEEVFVLLHLGELLRQQEAAVVTRASWRKEVGEFELVGLREEEGKQDGEEAADGGGHQPNLDHGGHPRLRPGPGGTCHVGSDRG